MMRITAPPPAPPAGESPTRPRHEGAPAEPRVLRRGHRPPLPLAAAVVVALLIAAGWWATTWPRAQAPAALVASGTLEADDVLIASEVIGRIVELVNEGDSVPGGGIVARLDDSLPRLQMRQVDSATQQQLQIQLDRYVLRSPVAGVVTRTPMHVGEVVSPGQTVAAVADLSYLEMTAYVLERDLGKVRVGQAVAVTVDPFPGRSFAGVVVSMNPRAEFTPRNVQTQRDRLNLVFGVRIRVANPDGMLKPGMPADAAFEPLQ